jgi:hypothetical protein
LRPASPANGDDDDDDDDDDDRDRTARGGEDRHVIDAMESLVIVLLAR